MDNATLLGTIRKAGFSDYEAKCYLALMERDSLAVNEVAKLAGIPRPSAYDVLDKLMEKGLVSAIPGKTKRYSASDPEMLKEKALGSLKSELENIEKKRIEIVEREKDIRDNIDSVISTLGVSYLRNRHNGDPLDYIEIIKDTYQIHKKLMELTSNAKREILAFSKPPYTVSKELLKEQNENQLEPLRSGITIKSIYEVPKAQDEFDWWLSDVVSSVKAGEQARVIDYLPLKMVIIDEKTVLVPLEDPVISGTTFTAQVIEHSSLANGLRIFFNMMWETAQDFQLFKESLRAK